MHTLETDRLDILKIRRDIKYLRQITYCSQSKACLFFFLNHGPEKYTPITGKQHICEKRGQRMRRREAGLRYTCNILFKKKAIRSKYDKNLNIINLND